MPAHTYRVQVFASTSTGVDFTLNHADLVEIPERMGGQRVDLLEGKVESLDWQLGVVDRAEAFTQHLSNSSGLADLLIRRVRMSRTTAAGATSWETVATGRIAQIDQNNAGYRLTLSDERLIERNTEIFTSWQSDYPGTPPAFSGLYAWPQTMSGGDWRFAFSRRVGDYVELLASGLYGAPLLTDEYYRLLEDDRNIGEQPRTKANIDLLDVNGKTLYRNWRFAIGGFSPTVGSDDGFRIIGWGYDGTYYGTEVPRNEETGERVISSIWVYDPNTDIPATADSIGTLFPARSMAPTERTPYRLGNIGNWLHPLKLAQWIYSGAYQSTATWDGVALPVLTVNYSTAHLGEHKTTLLTALANDPDYPALAFAIKRPWRMDEFLRTYCYKPFQVLPVCGPDGKVAPISVRLPTASSSYATTGLPLFNGSNCVGVPSWTHGARDKISRVNVDWESYNPSWMEQYAYVNFGSAPWGTGETLAWNPQRAEEISRQTHRYIESYDKTPEAYRREATFQLQTLWYAFKEYAPGIAQWVFERYGAGPQVLAVKTQNSQKGVNIGDVVRVNLDSVPNTALSQRGGTVLAQVLTKTYLRDGVHFELLHAGRDLQPIAAPTVTLSASTVDPYHTVLADVTMADIRDSYRLQLAQSTSSPGATDWRFAGKGTADEQLQVGELAMGKTYWARARAYRENRVGSTWAASTAVTLSAPNAPSAVTVSTSEITGYQAPISWTAGTNYYRTMIMDGSAATSNQMAIAGEGDVTFTLAGLSPGTTYDLYLWHIDYYGGHTAASTQVSFATLSTSDPGFKPNLKRPAYVRLLTGKAYNPQQSTG